VAIWLDNTDLVCKDNPEHLNVINANSEFGKGEAKEPLDLDTFRASSPHSTGQDIVGTPCSIWLRWLPTIQSHGECSFTDICSLSV